MTPGEAATIAAVARDLRGRIYAGEFPVGSKVPSRQRLAREAGISPESAGVVLRMLAAQGLVSLQQGSGTYVLPRHRYRVGISLRHATAQKTPALARYQAAIQEAISDEPAASDGAAGGTPGTSPAEMPVTVLIETGGLAQAVTLALDLIRSALRGKDGKPSEWDLDGASVQAEPEAGPG